MYERTFSPWKVKNLVIPNRIVMPAMVTDFNNPDNTCSERYIRYMEERAKGGFGLLITEDFCIEENRKGYPNIPGFYNDGQIEGFRRLTERIHQYPTKIFAQIYHPGRQSVSYLNNGRKPVAPSPVPCPAVKEMPEEITIEEIARVVEEFGEAAERAQKAGFDGVEVHMAHGYLLFEFLSPITNKRTDRYGGCLYNRMRIVKEICESIRKRVGDDFIISCRLSSRDGQAGGREIMDAVENALFLQEFGYDMINVSSGMYGRHTNYDLDNAVHAFNLPNCERIREAVDIPIIYGNSLNDLMQIEAILKTNKADACCLGRQAIADPYLPEKTRKGNYEGIRHCINCNLGCFGSVEAAFHGGNGEMTCAVNPFVGLEYKYDLGPAANPRKILIAGGGPGGMEAAYLAKRKGHDVTLYEASGRLGGQFISAAYPPRKGLLTSFTAWQIHMLEKYEVPVKLNTPLTKEIVEAEKPDLVIVACGGRAKMPLIPGIHNGNVVTAEQVLLGEAETGDHVVVCGGGTVGVETAAYAAMKDNGKVTVLGRSKLEADLQYKKLFAEYEVDTVLGANVKEIRDHSVLYEREGKLIELRADTVVMAFGYQPDDSLAKSLEGLCDIRNIGGSVKSSDMLDATRDAFRVIMDLE